MGEEAAARWLEARGFAVVERNWRCGRYEVDIIALKEGQLHIVEVKCRVKNGLTVPEEAYTEAKFAALQRAAEAYILEKGIDTDTRFDLVSVVHSNGKFEVEYIPDVMVPSW